MAGKVAFEHNILSSLPEAPPPPPVSSPTIPRNNPPPPPKFVGKVTKNLLFLAKPNLVFAKAFN